MKKVQLLSAMSNRKKIAKRGFRPTHSVIDEIERIHNTFSGKYNAYLCQTCNSGFLTLDIDHGTTPMFMRCLATEGCEGMAASAGYPEGDPPDYLGEPIVHWVKPENMSKVPVNLQSYVQRGGLIAQATEATPEWAKSELNLITQSR
jgi:hypothetical protein